MNEYDWVKNKNNNEIIIMLSEILLFCYQHSFSLLPSKRKKLNENIYKYTVALRFSVRGDGHNTV